jgi:hypothetical protein
MKRFKALQVCVAFMILILSVLLFTGCNDSDEAALVTAQFDNVLPNTCTATGPKVNEVIPANNTVNVPINTTITAYFDEVMDPTTIAYTDQGDPQVVTFTIYDNDYPGVLIEGTVAMDLTNTIAIFTPTKVLEKGTKYTATITKYAKRLSPHTELGCSYRWEFQTTDQ